MNLVNIFVLTFSNISSSLDRKAKAKGIFIFSTPKKQPFADVLQNRCPEKFRNIHRQAKTPVLESLFKPEAL